MRNLSLNQFDVQSVFLAVLILKSAPKSQVPVTLATAEGRAMVEPIMKRLLLIGTINLLFLISATHQFCCIHNRINDGNITGITTYISMFLEPGPNFFELGFWRFLAMLWLTQ